MWKVNNPNTTPIKVDTVKYKIRASIDNLTSYRFRITYKHTTNCT